MPREELLTPPQVGALFRTHEFRVRSRQFVVETNSDDLARTVETRFADLAAGDAGAESGVIVYSVIKHDVAASHPWGVWRDGEPCETTITPGYVVPYVLWELTRLLLESTPPGVPIHAAAATRAGKALVLAGRTHAGKSTLAAWLTHRGWGFLTDEVAVLDLERDRPWVQPFWRPVGVRHGGPLDPLVERTPGQTESLVPASSIGTLGSQAPLAAFVMPHYSPGEAGDLTPLSPAAALTELTRHLPTLRRCGRQFFRSLVPVVEAVPAFSLRVDDLDEAEARLSALMDGLR
jgi:hypothetical protein